MNERTTVTLQRDIYSRLTGYGKTGESFNNLIKRVLDELDGARNKSSCHRFWQ